MKEILDRLQQIAQILSLLAVPVLIAIFGSMFQSEVKEKEISRDFVQMAVSILTAPSRNDTSSEPLREWASRMLDHASPVPFKENEFAALKTDPAYWGRTFIQAKCQLASKPVEEPDWAAANLSESDSLEVKVRALLAERRQRIGYEKELVAAVAACR